MSTNNKVGFHFVKSLPEQLNSGDDFAFYFVKNKSDNNIIDFFFGRRKLIDNDLVPEFIKLNKELNYYIKSINNIKSDENGNFNLSISDLIDNKLSLNDFIINYLKNKKSLIGSVKNQDLLNLENKDLINNNIIISDELNLPLINELKNNLFFGNKYIFNNSLEVKNNILFVDELNIPLNKININDNLFIGGVYDEFPNADNLSKNIYIKNLGFGNTNNYFNFFNKIKLSESTQLLNSDFNQNNIGFEILGLTNNNEVVKLDSEYYFSKLNNSSKLKLKEIFFNELNIFNNKNNNITFITHNNNDNPYNFNNRKNVKIISDTYSMSSIQSNNLTLIGETCFTNNSNSIVFGNNKIHESSEISNSILIGDENFYENEIVEINNSILIGDYNFSTTINNINIDNSTLIGNNFFANSEIISLNNSVILGSVNGVYSQNTINNSILIGNFYNDNYNINNKFIVAQNNISNNINHKPLLEGIFVNPNNTIPEFKINAKLQLDINKLTNSSIDITHNKVLTINSLGEVGYKENNLINDNESKIKKYVLHDDFVMTSKRTNIDEIITLPLKVNNLIPNKIYKIKAIIFTKSNQNTCYVTLREDFEYKINSNCFLNYHTGVENGLFTVNYQNDFVSNTINRGAEMLNSTHKASIIIEGLIEPTREGQLLLQAVIKNRNNNNDIVIHKGTFVEVEEIDF